MKKFWIGIFGIILVFSIGFANQGQKKKNIKFRFNIPVVENYISSQFDSQDWNLSLNEVGFFYENIAWDFLLRFTEGAKDWFVTGIGYSNEYPGAEGFVIAKSYNYKQGHIFPLYGNRELSFTRSGLPLRVGIDIRLSENLLLGLEYHRSRNLVLQLNENLDFITLDNLEARRLSGFGDWLDEYTVFDMEFSRTFEEMEKTFKFRNINFDILLKYDLFGNSEKLSFYPELGINLCVLKKKLKGTIKKYNYEPSFFPEDFWPDEPLENYRKLITEDKLKKTKYKLTPRFFMGASVEYNLFKFMGISCEARLHNKSRKELFQEDSIFDDLLFDLKLSKFTLSAGIFFTF